MFNRLFSSCPPLLKLSQCCTSKAEKDTDAFEPETTQESQDTKDASTQSETQHKKQSLQKIRCESINCFQEVIVPIENDDK